MSLGGPPEAQLMLLPARTPAEASAWGSVAMEYAGAFETVHFARDPETVDWRGYQRVSIVRPSFWPDDLLLLIRQANPVILIDRIPVDTPEALQFILHVRTYYGWRYGPQNDFDWARLWPPGKALIGLHGRSNGELQSADYAIVRAARMEAVKITSHATLQTVRQLRVINPEMFILVRPMAAFTTVAGSPRRVTPQEFFEWTVDDLDRLLNYDPSLRFVEIHNEPNVTLEGLTASWRDGLEFGQWFLDVLHRYRQRYPNLQFGFPGLSPGPTSAAQGRMSSALFLEQAASAAQQADWIGLHAYWVSEREFSDEALGLAFAQYRERFPEKLLFITEFGNPQQPKSVVAEQYARYYGLLRRVPGLGAAFAYVVSTSDAVESPRWAWRDEAGRDLGIAAEIGRRRFIRDEVPTR
jgi:hypothetical protein